MGGSFSCPLSDSNDLDVELETIVVKSIRFGDEEKTAVRSVSFKTGDSEAAVMKSVGSGKMTMEVSVSFKGGEVEKKPSFQASSTEKENVAIASISSKSEPIENNSSSDTDLGIIQILPALDPTNPKHVAALKLQKVYKSFRIRRKLADCAVLVEQSWWKLLDFAELKRSSISFFDMEKHETAVSRWSRARTRAAKVGKGLSKNGKAQKLALQHWLEAIDPRHRYGHNLHFYYDKWLHSQSREPFFYWLDIGEGKEVNLEKCPRSKLQQQCIKYLGPMERLAYEVVVEDGKFLYKQSRELLHTSGDGRGCKWIFVLSTSNNLYVAKKKKGTFQHSSFLAGGATTAAGRLVVENGILKSVWPHSGHYQPTEENFKDFISFLRESNVDLNDVKMSPVDEEDDLLNRQSSVSLRNNSSEEDLIEKMNGSESEESYAVESTPENVESQDQETSAPLLPSELTRLHSFGRKLSSLEIPDKDELREILEKETQSVHTTPNNSPSRASSVAYDETAEGYLIASNQDSCAQRQNLFEEDHEGSEEESIPEESILKRISSHKETTSYQLGKKLSCRWTTGAGPRIGCVRDYPSQLQYRVLEKVNLSPRTAARFRLNFSPRIAGGPSPRFLTSMRSAVGQQ